MCMHEGKTFIHIKMKIISIVLKSNDWGYVVDRKLAYHI